LLPFGQVKFKSGPASKAVIATVLSGGVLSGPRVVTRQGPMVVNVGGCVGTNLLKSVTWNPAARESVVLSMEPKGPAENLVLSRLSAMAPVRIVPVCGGLWANATPAATKSARKNKGFPVVTSLLIIVVPPF
jgi:hypothetical protein